MITFIANIGFINSPALADFTYLIFSLLGFTIPSLARPPWDTALCQLLHTGSNTHRQNVDGAFVSTVSVAIFETAS